MDKDRIIGAANEAKGALKEAAGKALDDPVLAARGKADKDKGRVQHSLGLAKDALKDVLQK